MDPAMMGMPPEGAPMDPNMMKSDSMGESGLSAEGEAPITEAVGMDSGDDKVLALFNQLMQALSESAHLALDSGDIGKLMRLSNIQANVKALSQDVGPLVASPGQSGLEGGAQIAKAGRFVLPKWANYTYAPLSEY